LTPSRIKKKSTGLGIAIVGRIQADKVKASLTIKQGWHLIRTSPVTGRKEKKTRSLESTSTKDVRGEPAGG